MVHFIDRHPYMERLRAPDKSVFKNHTHRSKTLFLSRPYVHDFWHFVSQQNNVWTICDLR